jgi:hypothetical protein
MKAGKWIVYFVMIMLGSGSAMAGGDKVRGDKGEGGVVQTQVRKAAPEEPYVALTPAVVNVEQTPVLPEYDDTEEDEQMF